MRAPTHKTNNMTVKREDNHHDNLQRANPFLRFMEACRKQFVEELEPGKKLFYFSIALVELIYSIHQGSYSPCFYR
jgi:hypothetical protein